MISLSMTAAVRLSLVLPLAGWHAGLAAPQVAGPERGSSVARGVCFHDLDGDGVKGAHEPGVAGARVSNGREVVATGSDGRWTLAVDGDCALFVIEPRGWRVPLDADGKRRFAYVHKPAGSPPSGDPNGFAGVAPTGILPNEIDFALLPDETPSRFAVLLLADPAVRDRAALERLRNDVLAPLVGQGGAAAGAAATAAEPAPAGPPAFGMTLGDLVHGDLALLDDWHAAVATLGIAWHHVLGNRDQNLDAPDDARADETWERVFGPTAYAFDRGSAHFVVLDNAIHLGRDASGRPRYRGGFSADQLAFVAADLEHVAHDALCVFAMHVPLFAVEPADRAAFLALFDDRPHTLSIAAHARRQMHLRLGPADGWRGETPHRHLVVGALELAGTDDSERGGAEDPAVEAAAPERGAATMADGTPPGWTRLFVDGHSWSFEFVPVGHPPAFQIAVHAPESPAADLPFTVSANVFAGSERSQVELELGGAWHPMVRVEAVDPLAAQRFAASDGRQPEPRPSTHLWQLEVPGLAAGAHTLRVRAQDPAWPAAAGELHGACQVRVGDDS